MSMKNMLTGLLVLLIFPAVFAQKDYRKEADAVFSQERYFEAIELYKKAYTREKEDKAGIIFQIAECYRSSDNHKQAEVWYSKAIKGSYDDPMVYFYLGESQKLSGKYEDAQASFEKYVERMPKDPKGKKALKSCELSLQWLETPTRFEINNAPLINSEQNDFSPMFADKKHNMLFFTSSREGSAGSDIHGRTGQNFSDIYTTKRDKKGKWSEPIPLGENVNSPVSEGAACLNSKKNTIYFTRCGFGKDGVFGCQIFWAKKQGTDWGAAEVIPITEDTNAVGHPAISVDDKTLVFASDMPGGYGGKDLWYVTNLGKNQWSEPVNLGSNVNTADDELFPFLDFENKLYFSSNGHVGMGGMDIFVATDQGKNQWGNVENLQSPLNSPLHDYGVVFDGRKPKGYLASNREGGMGGDDIWEFYLPALQYALEGVVKDLETGEVLADATVTLKGSDGTSAQVSTDVNGEFEFAQNGPSRYIKPNTTYELLVGKKDFLNAKGMESTVDLEVAKIFYHEYRLRPIDKPIKLPQILYELGSAELLPESKDSLNFLYDILVENPNITIELRSHTDSRDTDARNQKLSERRAQSCINYLVSLGIAGDRMRPLGVGERELLYSDAEINKLPTKEEREALHAKNRRTDFKVLSTDYVPRN